MSSQRIEIGAIQMPDGSLVYLKDEYARELLAKGIQYIVVGRLPEASADTMGIFYLVRYAGDNGQQNNYMEYITVEIRPEELGAPTYSWECLGERRLDLSGYSQIGHVHHVTSNVEVGDHSYTPAGGVQTEVGTENGHAHNIPFITKYLHKTSVVKSLVKSVIPTGLKITRLVTRKIRGVTGVSATASHATPGLAISVARAGQAVAVPCVERNATGSVNVNCTPQAVASGALGMQTNTQGADTPLWGCTVDNGVLKFIWKPLVSVNVVQSVTATTDATKTEMGHDIEIVPAVSNGSITPYTFTDVTVPIAGEEVDVATGGVSPTGDGADVAVGNNGETSVVTDVDETEDVFNVANTEPNGGEVIVQGSHAGQTGTAGSHSHTAESVFTGTPVTLAHSVVNNSVVTQPED